MAANRRAVILGHDESKRPGVRISRMAKPPPFGEHPGVDAPRKHDKYDALIKACDALTPARTVVAHPCDEISLSAAIAAANAKIIQPLLVGPKVRIEALASSLQLELAGVRVVDVPHSHAAAARAVAMVRSGEADILMKGSLHTDELMAEVVRGDTGIRTGRRISHVFIMDVPTYAKPLFITDGAVNIFPNLEDKMDIVQNAIQLAHALGIALPKVAILSALETITSKIPSTIDAAALCKMAERGQITGAVLDGPLAFDNAISREAAAVKHIKSSVAGDADILVVPDMEAGNLLAKELSFLANADAAGIVLGARVPIVLTSRADNIRTHMASCAVAALYARAQAVAVLAGMQRIRGTADGLFERAANPSMDIRAAR
ncbi:MAG TPA: phosphate acetyltransferase [Steroidobacteraceae bacterium]|nr:phosphate acetyltransferase [Steroidobacteraceae bacterium]